MEKFGVHKDLESYKKLLNVFPKGRFIPENRLQVTLKLLNLWYFKHLLDSKKGPKLPFGINLMVSDMMAFFHTIRGICI